jgi:hypothetical protein
LDYFDRKIYENQKEFFFESISKTFNRFNIPGSTSRRVSSNVVNSLTCKSRDESPIKKPKKEEAISKKM